jgi:hypothetical protein
MALEASCRDIVGDGHGRWQAVWPRPTTTALVLEMWGSKASADEGGGRKTYCKANSTQNPAFGGEDSAAFHDGGR